MPRMRRLSAIVLLSALPLLAACSGWWSGSSASHDGPAADGAPLLYKNLGRYSYRITTTSSEAQRWFDQGLRLVYAFNHAEAQRAFREAARLDPGCAMCAWGVAITEGSNYNDPTNAEREARALAAVRQAQQHTPGVTPVERALIDALARRHSGAPGATRAALDRAYADAMREVARRFPLDLDAQTFFADALMNLRPWNLWTPDGTPQPETAEIVTTLERVLARDPEHPGAAHLYIHAVEASTEPGRAEAAADRLLKAMPGAGHLVHMPSHIYWRVGRYADAVSANHAAVQADRAYFKTAKASPIYRGLYHPHNIDFIWQSTAMQGRAAETLKAARELAAAAPAEMVSAMPDMETAPMAPLVSLARFGRWDDVLREPAPSKDWRYATGLWHYARGLAFNAKGQGTEARAELTALEAGMQAMPPERTVAFFFRARTLLQLAANVLAGEIAAKGGDYATAERLLRAAVAEQDTHWFTEPPPWYFPVRHALGAVLVQAGRGAAAEQVYREDLVRNPGNGWALYGLTLAFRAEGKTDAAQQSEVRFRKAWAKADVTLSASRF